MGIMMVLTMETETIKYNETYRYEVSDNKF